jgi:hypothetical protein
MKEKQKGGNRKGAGRKPSLDPKQPVTIFVETSIIDSFGGKEGLQLFCYNAIHGSHLTPFSSPKDIFDAKKLPPSDDEIKAKTSKERKRTIVTDYTKPTGVLKTHEQPKTNYSVDTHPKNLEELKSRCPAELEEWDRREWIRTERQKYGI